MPFYKISTLHHCYTMHVNITLHLAFLNWLFPFTMWALLEGAKEFWATCQSALLS